jgi:hypothetical protein
MDNPIVAHGWRVHFALTASAGVKIYLADFKGKRVVWEASLPYVLVDHQRQDVRPDEPPPEAHGPWWTPLGERSLASPIRRTDVRGGFELAADFDCGIYRFTQLWRFLDDGRIEPWLTIHGRGVHDAHTYHPHWRFDFDLASAERNAVEHWVDGRWERVAEEGWLPATGAASPEGYVWRQIDFDSGASLSIRPHRTEDAEIFALRYSPSDWPPHTPRAAAGAQPYPASSIGSAPLDDTDVTLWYVGHVHYHQGFPYTAGAWMKVEGL